MSSTQSSRPSHAAETAQLTPDQLDVLYSAEVFDEDGQSHQLDRITQGKRVLLVFIRHFCELLHVALVEAKRESPLLERLI